MWVVFIAILAVVGGKPELPEAQAPIQATTTVPNLHRVGSSTTEAGADANADAAAVESPAAAAQRPARSQARPPLPQT